ncbi:MAG: hypothetical protein ACYTE3_03510 [Planctomycetota bacterium]|jgi:hypothetical protein
MKENPEQRARASSKTARRLRILIWKGIYYTCILVAATIASHLIHYQLSAPSIDLSRPVKIISHDKIQIKGPEGFPEATVKALNLLRQKDPENYQMIKDYLGRIECVKKGSGVFMWERPPRFVVGEKSVEVPTRIYASSIVHEAYHSKLYNDALRNGRDKAEALGVSTGRKAELACAEMQGESLAKITGFLPFRWLDWLNLAFSKRRPHEEIPYEDRYW